MIIKDFLVQGLSNRWKAARATGICLILTIFIAGTAVARMVETKTVSGVKATLSATTKMVDLLLVDAGSGKAMTGAGVGATIVSPGGKEINGKLMGMKMGETYSYMNSVDLSESGVYTFHITVRAGGREVEFIFKGEVR